MNCCTKLKITSYGYLCSLGSLHPWLFLLWLWLTSHTDIKISLDFWQSLLQDLCNKEENYVLDVFEVTRKISQESYYQVQKGKRSMKKKCTRDVGKLFQSSAEVYLHVQEDMRQRAGTELVPSLTPTTTIKSSLITMEEKVHTSTLVPEWSLDARWCSLTMPVSSFKPCLSADAPEIMDKYGLFLPIFKKSFSKSVRLFQTHRKLQTF